MFDIVQRRKFGISKQLRDKLTIHMCIVARLDDTVLNTYFFYLCDVHPV
jgi:hypothetical protein